MLEYVEANADVLLAPFSQRLARAVDYLAGTGAQTDIEVQRRRISECLHIEHLGRLRQLLGAVLADKNKVVILIDNLDENWGSGRDTAVLSGLLHGLLRETLSLAADFHHSDMRQKSVNVSLTSFIRSDIFAYIHPLVSERDKWPLHRMSWSDSELLLRVLDERLQFARPTGSPSERIWAELFAPEVVGLPVRDFILRNTLQRPRDVIYLVKAAIAIAVNRGHARVNAEDLLAARIQYSRYVFDSILAEDDPARGRLEEVLLEFAGAGRTLTESDVRSRIHRAGVTGDDVDFYLELLCDVNFLGIQTASGFAFADDEHERARLLDVAKRLRVDRSWDEVGFEINAAFYQALQID